jgi:hypothetical protein
MTPRASEAYAAWYEAKRAFDDTLPWTAEWLRLRLIEQELRSEWERLALDDEYVVADRSENGDAATNDATPRDNTERLGCPQPALGTPDQLGCVSSASPRSDSRRWRGRMVHDEHVIPWVAEDPTLSEASPRGTRRWCCGLFARAAQPEG